MVDLRPGRASRNLCDDIKRNKDDVSLSTGYLSRFITYVGGNKFRKLCEVYYSEDDIQKFYVPMQFSPVVNRAGKKWIDYTNNIAYVVTLKDCTLSPTTDYNTTFLYDIATVQKQMICNNSKACIFDNMKSKYNYTLYAIIHSDYTSCPIEQSDGTTKMLNRAKVLQDVGYWVKIFNEPVYSHQIKNKALPEDVTMDNVDLLRLHALNMTEHPLVVMMDFDTYINQPLDDIYDHLLGNNELKAAVVSLEEDTKKISKGFLIVKPNELDFKKMKNIYANFPYDADGWSNGIGKDDTGAQGLLSYFYSLPQNKIVNLNDCEYYLNVMNSPVCSRNLNGLPPKVMRASSNVCGAPFDCNDHEKLRNPDLCSIVHKKWFMSRTEFQAYSWINRSCIGANCGGSDLVQVESVNSNGGVAPDVYQGYCTSDYFLLPTVYHSMISKLDQGVINPAATVHHPKAIVDDLPIDVPNVDASDSLLFKNEFEQANIAKGSKGPDLLRSQAHKEHSYPTSNHGSSVVSEQERNISPDSHDSPSLMNKFTKYLSWKHDVEDASYRESNRISSIV